MTLLSTLKSLLFISLLNVFVLLQSILLLILLLLIFDLISFILYLLYILIYDSDYVNSGWYYIGNKLFVD